MCSIVFNSLESSPYGKLCDAEAYKRSHKLNVSDIIAIKLFVPYQIAIVENAKQSVKDKYFTRLGYSELSGTSVDENERRRKRPSILFL